MQPLALQPALHVGEGDDDGVDLAGLDAVARSAVMVRWRSLRLPMRAPASSGFSPAGRAAARRCRRSVPPSRVRARSGSPARIAVTTRRVLAVGVGDVRPAGPGSPAASRAAWPALRSPPRSAAASRSSAAMVRWSRESACRCAAGRRRLATLPRAPSRARGAVGSARSAPAARAAAPGSTIRRKSQGVEPVRRVAGDVRAAARADGVRGLQRDHGAAAAAAGGLDQSGLPQRGHRLAQRGPRDVEPLGQLALGRQRSIRAGRRPAGSPWPAAPRRPRRRGAPAPAAARPR